MPPSPTSSPITSRTGPRSPTRTASPLRRPVTRSSSAARASGRRAGEPPPSDSSRRERRGAGQARPEAIQRSSTSRASLKAAVRRVAACGRSLRRSGCDWATRAFQAARTSSTPSGLVRPSSQRARAHSRAVGSRPGPCTKRTAAAALSPRSRAQRPKSVTSRPPSPKPSRCEPRRACRRRRRRGRERRGRRTRTPGGGGGARAPARSTAAARPRSVRQHEPLLDEHVERCGRRSTR